LDLIAGAGAAITAEAAVGICSQITLKTRCLIIVEGTMQALVFIRPQAVMLQYHGHRQLLLYGFDLYGSAGW